MPVAELVARGDVPRFEVLVSALPLVVVGSWEGLGVDEAVLAIAEWGSW